MSKQTKILLAAIGVVFLGAVAVRLSRPAIERKILKGRGMTPAEIDGYYRWKNDPITWPDEATSVEPFSDELKTAAYGLRSRWKDLEGINHKVSSAIGGSVENPPPLEAFEPLEAVLDGFSALVRMPDYELTVFVVGCVDTDDPQDLELPYSDTTVASFLTSVLAKRSASLAARGQLAKAARDIDTIGRAARISPWDAPMDQMISVWILRGAVNQWIDLNSTTDELGFLRELMKAQNDAAERAVAFPKGNMYLQLEHIGGLRALKRRGSEVDIKGLSGAGVADAYSMAQARYLREIVVPWTEARGQKADRIYEQAGYFANGWMEGGSLLDFGGSFWRGAILNTNKKAHWYGMTMSMIDFDEMRRQALLVRARLDLARIRVASRLYELEKGAEAESLGDLAPDYLPTIPVDPFAGDGAGYRRADGRYYSVGPDGVDDGRALTYDPANGAASAGDIFLPPEG